MIKATTLGHLQSNHLDKKKKDILKILKNQTRIIYRIIFDDLIIFKLIQINYVLSSKNKKSPK